MNYHRSWTDFWVCLWLCLGLMLVGGIASASSDIPEDSAIRAIIGEDSSSYEGMYAVACAIRNRGSLQGVYGLKAIRWSDGVLKRYSGARISEVIAPSTFQMAQKAWFDSEDGKDVTGGAKHWEGTQFKTPKWASNDSTVIGGNRFYRGVK